MQQKLLWDATSVWQIFLYVGHELVDAAGTHLFETFVNLLFCCRFYKLWKTATRTDAKRSKSLSHLARNQIQIVQTIPEWKVNIWINSRYANKLCANKYNYVCVKLNYILYVCFCLPTMFYCCHHILGDQPIIHAEDLKKISQNIKSFYTIIWNSKKSFEYVTHLCNRGSHWTICKKILRCFDFIFSTLYYCFGLQLLSTPIIILF